MMAIINESQCRMQGLLTPYIRYNPLWTWRRAKEIDGFDDTSPQDNEGTTVEAISKVMSTSGLVLWDNPDDWSDGNQEGEKSYGIESAKWAKTVDEMRTAISMNIPITIGINWYAEFNKPDFDGAEYWIGKDLFNTNPSGHALCVFGASDQRQAFRIKNSWLDWPEVWMPYKSMERLMTEDGEVMLPSDRVY